MDEAGRGPLAGPVVAAAVILDRRQTGCLLSMGLKDSKKLSPSRREKIFREILSLGVVWRAQAASHRRIDDDNILAATLWAMGGCVCALPVVPDLVVVDGSVAIPVKGFRQKTLPGGDGIVPAIAAASVVAKVLRDRVMVVLDGIFPEYCFKKNKGYPSREHVERLRAFGPCPVHRRSFNVRGWSAS